MKPIYKLRRSPSVRPQHDRAAGRARDRVVSDHRRGHAAVTVAPQLRRGRAAGPAAGIGPLCHRDDRTGSAARRRIWLFAGSERRALVQQWRPDIAESVAHGDGARAGAAGQPDYLRQQFRHQRVVHGRRDQRCLRPHLRRARRRRDRGNGSAGIAPLRARPPGRERRETPGLQRTPGRTDQHARVPQRHGSGCAPGRAARSPRHGRAGLLHRHQRRRSSRHAGVANEAAHLRSRGCRSSSTRS